MHSQFSIIEKSNPSRTHCSIPFLFLYLQKFIAQLMEFPHTLALNILNIKFKGKLGFFLGISNVCFFCGYLLFFAHMRLFVGMFNIILEVGLLKEN